MQDIGHLPALGLNGQRVLVTAGGSGIGRTMAETFASAGARVHLTDISAAALDATLAAIPTATGTLGDAALAADVDRVKADVLAQLGGLDVLVNNAGIAGPTGGVDSYDDSDVERTIQVNLTSHFYFLRRFVPMLKASKSHPSILAMSSVAGRMGYSYRTPYAATKWAIVGLVKSLAAELGPDGVRVNAILPGPVQGERMDRVIAARAEVKGISFEEMREEYLKKASLRRMVEAQDVADMALFLASGMSRNISGQVISVDGNMETT